MRVPCLDYSFDVLISRIGNVGLYNRFSYSYLPHFMFICAYVNDTSFLYTCAWYARHWALLYVLAGLHLTTLDSHVQILEPGVWWLGCNWSECAADPPVVVRVQQKLRRRRRSSFQFLFCLTLEALPCCSWASLSFYYVYLFMYCTLVFSGDVIFL